MNSWLPSMRWPVLMPIARAIDTASVSPSTPTASAIGTSRSMVPADRSGADSGGSPIGNAPIESWQVAGGHMAERSGLFMIVALGESIIVTGTVFSRSDLTASSVLAFLAAFVGTILFWLLYFSHGVMVAWSSPGTRMLGLLEALVSTVLVVSASWDGMRARLAKRAAPPTV